MHITIIYENNFYNFNITLKYWFIGKIDEITLSGNSMNISMNTHSMNDLMLSFFSLIAIFDAASSIFWWLWQQQLSLREMCPNTELFLVRIFLYSDWIRRDTAYLSVFSPNTGKYGPEITPHLDTFHAVSLYSNVLIVLMPYEWVFGTFTYPLHLIGTQQHIWKSWRHGTIKQSFQTTLPCYNIEFIGT